MESFQIKGKVAYQSLGTGFWGIVDAANRKWRPVNLPANMRQEGLEIEVTVKKADQEASIFMWGNPVEIITN